MGNHSAAADRAVHNVPIGACATGSREIPYSQFLRDADSSRIRDVVITGHRITGSYTENGATFQTYAPGIDDQLVDRLQAKNTVVTVRPETDGSSSFLSYLALCFR